MFPLVGNIHVADRRFLSFFLSLFIDRWDEVEKIVCSQPTIHWFSISATPVFLVLPRNSFRLGGVLSLRIIEAPSTSLFLHSFFSHCSLYRRIASCPYTVLQQCFCFFSLSLFLCPVHCRFVGLGPSDNNSATPTNQIL